jgi:hypothetical protein
MAYLILRREAIPGGCGCRPGCTCPRCRPVACSPGCNCWRCRSLSLGLGERYIEADDEAETPARPPTQGPSGPFAPVANGGRARPTENESVAGGFGEEPAWRRRLSLTPGLQLRLPPFEVITGFTVGSATLTAAHLARIDGVGQFIVRSWSTANPIISVRLAGYIDANEWQGDLGRRRAEAVQAALLDVVRRVQPELLARVRFEVEDRGFSPPARVELYLWAGPTPPPPAPPLVRVPSPAEAARTIVPPGPERPEARIQRLLRSLPPAPPRGRSLSQVFWQRVDSALNRAMDRVRVPPSLRGPLRAGVHAALERGAEAVLDRVLEASELGSEGREAIKTSIRAFFRMAIP